MALTPAENLAKSETDTLDSTGDAGGSSANSFSSGIYEPPKADLSVAPDETLPEFYVVSAKKFVVLFVATIGIFSIYWFYQNWRNYKARHQTKMVPVLRAIFNIFFTHSLFEKVNEKLDQRGQSYSWSPTVLATIYVLLSITSQVTDRMSQQNLWMPYADIVSLACFPVTLWVLLKAQKAINASQGDAAGAGNSAFTLYNYLWIVLGLSLWVLIGWAIVAPLA